MTSLLNPVRNADESESQADYWARRNNGKNYAGAVLTGKIVWNPKNQGTYIRGDKPKGKVLRRLEKEQRAKSSS
jgi:hypothetical protein